MRAASIRDHTEYITLVDKYIVEFPNLAMDNMIYAFIYSLKLHMKGFIKPQVQKMANVSLNEVMILALKREKNSSMASRCYDPFNSSRNSTMRTSE